ncbi:MAG TPA: sigma-70 family RNA polymerase sigma factor [Terriglobia bacterium]|jgi:RNA polymerase sigma-70 factor (ECF subfamily)|nr:sigma-70 family RNA polymerase sigma factor [Terriglobia bacterium]
MQAALLATTFPLREVSIPNPADDLEHLFQAHHGMVFRTAYRITGNASDAEDVLQTVFLRLAGHSAAPPPLENSVSYMRRAAINASLDVIRSRRGREPEPLDPDYPEPPQPDRYELEDCLRQSLAHLSPEAAEMFSLRFLEGHSYNDIARILGVSRVRVGVTLHRARRRLQKEIRSYWEGRS